MLNYSAKSKFLAAAFGISLLAFPAIASAESCREKRNDNRQTGLVIGAIAGAAIGNAATKRDNRAAGTILGAVVGAAVGSEIAGNNSKCNYGRPYGYYDNSYNGYGYNDYDYGRQNGYDRRNDRREDRYDRRQDRRDDRHEDRYDRRDDRRDERYDHY